MSLKLYATPETKVRTYPALIAAKFNQIAISTPDFKSGEEKKPEFAKNVTGKVPFLETSGGFVAGASAVARYVAGLNPSTTLLGSNPLETAQVDSWIEAISQDFEFPVCALTLPAQGRADIPDAKVTQEAKKDVSAFFGLVSKHLQTRTYLVGESVTLADIYLFSALVEPFSLVLDRKLRDTFVNVTRWFSTIAALPEVLAVTGGVTLTEEAVAAKGKVAAEPKPKQEKTEAKPKQEKPAEKKPEEKKEAPKKPAKKDDDEEEEEEDEHEEKPKGKNPLDNLPKSKLNLEEWKRIYSNSPYDQSLKWFWENYDAEGYCIYFCDYKYDDENKVLFMTSNAIRGFFQRLENLHKYAFGTMLMLNEQPPFSIKGCWLFRGSEIPPDLKACDDYEYYVWTRADTNDAATRSKIDQFWSGALAGFHVDEDWKVFK